MNRCKKISQFKKEVMQTIALKGTIPTYVFQQKIKELTDNYNTLINSPEASNDCDACKKELLDLGSLCFN